MVLSDYCNRTSRKKLARHNDGSENHTEDSGYQDGFYTAYMHTSCNIVVNFEDSGRDSQSRDGTPQKNHSYKTNMATQCTPDELKHLLLEPGMTVPTAPQAHEGFEPRVELWGLTSPNPISQYVNLKEGIVVNTALEGHAFQGTVVNQVVEYADGTAGIHATGTGSGTESPLKQFWNDVSGFFLFTGRNIVLAQTCDIMHGIQPAMF